MSTKKLTDIEKIEFYNTLTQQSFSLINEKNNIKKPEILTDELILAWWEVTKIDKIIESCNRDNQELQDLYSKRGDESAIYWKDYYKRQEKYYFNHTWALFPDLTRTSNLHVTEDVLKKGGKVHIFRSGGGLRVVCITNKKGIDVGYGEHPFIEEALKHAEKDLKFGYTSYSDKYSGDKAKYTHYLTGSTYASSNLDSIVKSGATIDFTFDKKKEEFISKINTYEHVEIPEHIEELCLSDTNGQFFWTDHRTGILYESTAYQFPNGDWGTRMSVAVSAVYDVDPYFREVTRTGRDKKSLWQAIFNSIVAETAIKVKKKSKSKE